MFEEYGHALTMRVLIILRVNATVNYSGRYSYQFESTSGERITSTVLYEETISGENLVQLSVNYEGGLKRTDVLHLEPQKFKVQGSRVLTCKMYAQNL